jgi:uncharacterized membrane protein
VETGNAEKRKNLLPKLCALGATLVAVPVLIWLGISVWADRRYYHVRLLIILVSMAPFAVRFERKKLTARELAVLAVMTALGVAGRAAFYMIPQFKPIVAIAIITGVAFGAESGFIVGAMIAFTSNFIFGQGPWTPWQMEALGLMGLLAGLFFHKKGGGMPKMLPLLVFGALGTLILYGLIADTSTVFTVYGYFSWELALAAYSSGLVLNLIHAGATVIFLLALSKPLLKKLQRVRVKYGLLE